MKSGLATILAMPTLSALLCFGEAAARPAAPIEFRSAPRPTPTTQHVRPPAAEDARPARPARTGPRTSQPPQVRLASFDSAPSPIARSPIDLRGVLPPAPVFDPIPINEPLEDGRPAFDGATADPIASPSAPTSPPTSALRSGYVVQIGVFAEPANVERAQARLSDLGPLSLESRRLAARDATRVRLGPWATRSEAEEVLTQAEARGFAGAAILHAP